MSTGDQSETELGPHHHTKVSPTEAPCQLSLCFPVTCIPFLNTLLQMLKQRPEGLSRGLPTVSGKAVEDPVALCFPTVPLFPEASPRQALLLALGSFPVAVLGCLLQWAQVAPDPGSGHSVLSHHCPAQLRGLPPCSSSAQAQQCSELLSHFTGFAISGQMDLLQSLKRQTRD